MTTERIVAQTNLRAAPDGEVIASTSDIAAAPEWTGEIVDAGGCQWRKATFPVWVRTDRITSDAFRYVKQLADRNDPGAPEHKNSAECGLACKSMVLSVAGIVTDPIDVLSDRYDPDDNGTNSNDLIRMAADYGQVALAKNYTGLVPEPFTICLGMYAWRDRSKLDLPSFRGAHWVVFLEQLPNGDIVIADPLYRTARGARVVWSIDEWSRYWIKWGNGVSRVGVTPDRRSGADRLAGSGGDDLPDWILDKRNDAAFLF